MQPTTLFYILILILLISFIIDKVLDALNAKHFNDDIPAELADVYDKDEYKKSQDYKKANAKFSSINTLFSILVTIGFFFLDGFKYIDDFARSYSENSILVALIFFGVIIVGSDILTTPFSYYKTFVIEEKFGFNKSTKKLFWIDKIKGWGMSAILGGSILALIIWFYEFGGDNFWMYAWGLITVFSLFMNMFYAKIIVPLFNKQTQLEDGELKLAIEKYAKKVGFTLENITCTP
jgi:STE24 endopeptidase